MNRLLRIAALTAIAAPAGAGEPLVSGADIDRIAAAHIADDGPGCALGVIHDGEYVHKAGYGIANLEHDIPITSATVFRTGSLSKQFTAMAVAILAERGDLDLDADVHTYLPDLADYGHKVTVRQMVHHLAGMGDYDHEIFTGADGKPFRFGNEDYWTIEEFYEVVREALLVHPPGTRYEYSNLAYFLLGLVVERVSGQTLREFAAAEIFGPLGMSASFFNDDVNRVVPDRADGYRELEDGSYQIFMTNLSWVGDGGVYTNLDDFIHWDRNFYGNKLGKGGDALIEMTTTEHADTGYAFGQNVGDWRGERVFYHSGGWVAFSSHYTRFPDLSLSIVTFCNSAEIDASVLNEEVAGLYIEKPPQQNSGNDEGDGP